MHNNYYFIRQLVPELKALLEGTVLMECYSQNKDELVLSFLGDEKKEVHIVASLGADFSCLHFPAETHRAKKNSVSLFPDLPGQNVKDVLSIPNERLFVIDFTENLRLAFKLFGNRGNIILFLNNKPVSLFKNNLRQDKDFSINETGREVDYSFDNFQLRGLKKTFFTLGDLPEFWLKQNGYEDKADEEKYDMIIQLIKKLESPQYYITRVNGKVVLSLLETGEVLNKKSSAIEAVNSFYSAHFRYNFLEHQKGKILSLIDGRLKAGRAYIEKSEEKIAELSDLFPPEKVADIVMANLHAIPPGTEKVTLFDFYRNRDIEISLKKDITPQKYAESLYKKSKKRPMEMNRLQEQVRSKAQEMDGLLRERKVIEALENHRELEPFVKKYITAPEKEEQVPSLRFKECEYMGYKIYVGRNAENNDELTQKFAHKDDLWLHARDVTGSHVIVRHRTGQNFPKNVIEKAASLAAYYSKRKNETLCPVIYTLKKNVRKVKGAPKGAVKVERENVIMVPPADF